MYEVTAEQKQKIEEKVQWCLNVAKQHYPAHAHKFRMPRITYSLKGTSAGRAWAGSRWQVDFHPFFINKEWNDYINTTVPHEVAHLVAEAVSTFGRVGHGYGWKLVMQLFGIYNPKRCHTYDVDEVRRVRTVTSYTYQCTRCGKTHRIGPKRHAKLQADRSAYFCCRTGMLILAGSTKPQPTIREVSTTKIPAHRPAPNGGQSKIQICIELYKANRSVSRADMIKLFVSKAGCTAAGASTYYATCKQRIG